MPRVIHTGQAMVDAVVTIPHLPEHGSCFVMVEPSAERTFVTTLGAERRITMASPARCQAAGGRRI